MSRGKIIIVITVAVSALFIYFMLVDSEISGNLMVADVPDIVVEHIDFARVIQGREWRVKAVDAESKSGMISVRSLDINVLEPDTKRGSQIYASGGEYSTEEYKMWLRDVDGIVWLGDRSVSFSAKRADYDSSTDVWYFSEGVSAGDEEIFVTGGVAKIEPNGILSLGKGVRVNWNLR